MCYSLILQMGLGKTLQAISIAYFYKDEWPLLIVVPSSMRYPWIDEIEKWLPEIEPHEINLIRSGTDVRYCVVWLLISSLIALRLYVVCHLSDSSFSAMCCTFNLITVPQMGGVPFSVWECGTLPYCRSFGNNLISLFLKDDISCHLLLTILENLFIFLYHITKFSQSLSNREKHEWLGSRKFPTRSYSSCKNSNTSEIREFTKI